MVSCDAGDSDVLAAAEGMRARTDSSYRRHDSSLGIPVGHEISHFAHCIDEHADPAPRGELLSDVGHAVLPTATQDPETPGEWTSGDDKK